MLNLRRVLLVLLVLLIVPLSVHATCHGGNGHTARLSSRWPYSEDVANAPNLAANPPFYGSTPYTDVTVSYNNWQWTTIQSGCVDLGQKNLFASNSFNAFLRAQPTIAETTVPAGTLWESQLVLIYPDGSETVAAWDSRRLKGSGVYYYQAEHLGGIVAAVPAGEYSYQHRVRIIDNVGGYIKFSNQWTSGLGVPSSDYPSGGSAYNGQQVVSTSWIPVGNLLTIPTNATALDLSIVGSGKIVAGTLGAPLEIGVSVDSGSSGNQNGLIAVPAALPDGFTIFDHKINIAANQQHTLQLWMRASSGNVTVELPSLSYVAYPNSKPEDQARDEAEIRTMYTSAPLTNKVRVDAFTTAPQPDSRALSTICGKWTNVFEFDVPGGQQVGRPNTALATIVSGYVQFAGGIVGNSRAELSVEIKEYDYPGNTGTPYAAAEMGVSSIWATPGNDGVFFFLEGVWSNFDDHDHVTLWMRQIDDSCRGGGLGSGGFDVTKRYISVKFLPAPGTTYP